MATIAEDVILDTSPLEPTAPNFDKTTGIAYIRTQNGRTVAVKMSSLIEQLAQFKFLDEIAADQLAMLKLPGSGPAKTMAKNIATAGREMRAAQNLYFGNRSDTNLKVAKDLEAKFDKMITSFFKMIDYV